MGVGRAPNEAIQLCKLVRSAWGQGNRGFVVLVQVRGQRYSLTRGCHVGRGVLGNRAQTSSPPLCRSELERVSLLFTGLGSLC